MTSGLASQGADNTGKEAIASLHLATSDAVAVLSRVQILEIQMCRVYSQSLWSGLERLLRVGEVDWDLSRAVECAAAPSARILGNGRRLRGLEDRRPWVSAPSTASTDIADDDVSAFRQPPAIFRHTVVGPSSWRP